MADDFIRRKDAIQAILDLPNCSNGYSDAYDKQCIIDMLEEVPAADVRKQKWIQCSERLPEETHEKRTETHECDYIERQAAIDALKDWYDGMIISSFRGVEKVIKALPSAQPEPLTDKEQRIFLAAMGREEKVCEEVDRNYVREPYEDSLVRVCKEIRRKVKGALWI